MLRKVFPSDLKGCINAPPSKSYAHRALILSAFRKKSTFIHNPGDNEDIKATINSLRALGAEFSQNGSDVLFSEYDNGNIKDEIVNVDVGESGSTFRFILPLILVLGKKANVICHGRLKERPHDYFFNELREHGAEIESIPSGFKVFGKLQGDTYTIDSTISSQYITGLLLSLPYLNRECRITLKGESVSKSYLNITEDVLNKTGVNYSYSHNTYTVNGFSNSSHNSIFVEGDWSGASFFIVAGALSKDGIKVSSLNPASVQGDAQIIDIVRKFGAQVDVSSDDVFVKKGSKINPVSVNLDNMIDSVPILSVLASFANGVSEFSGIERLKYKESDRIRSVTDMLSSSGIKAEYKNKRLYIHGGEPHSGVFNGVNDHRIVMSASILASYVNDNNPSYVSTPDAVKKSYPGFFEDLKTIGGESCVKVDR